MNGAMGLVEPPGHHTQRGFKVINVQPSQMMEGVTVCPFYSLLLEGAMLVGNSKESVERYETYCGQRVSSTFANGGMFPESTNVTAVTFCDWVVNVLTHAISCVRSVIENEKRITDDNTIKCDSYLQLWAKIIPSYPKRKRSRKELLRYVERLREQIEAEAFGKKSEEEPSGCKQRPDSPGLTGKVY